MSQISKLVRPHLREFIGYQSARSTQSDASVWLNANELPEPLLETEISNINRYPDNQPRNLIQAYANYCSLPENQVLATRGADEGIEILIKGFCEPVIDKVLSFSPTYGMYGISSAIQNVDYVEIPWLDLNGSLDFIEIKKNLENIKLVFLCNPNNPTGTQISEKAFDQLMETLGPNRLVVIDEAYIEFSSKKSLASKMAWFPNLVILRTLSKAFGLANLRCGFVLAQAELITFLRSILAPYPLPGTVSKIAARALEPKNLQLMNTAVESTQRLRARLLEKLQGVKGLKVNNSEANFIWVQGCAAKSLYQYFLSQGVLVRAFSNEQAFACRMSIGSIQEVLVVEQALDAFNTEECVS